MSELSKLTPPEAKPLKDLEPYTRDLDDSVGVLGLAQRFESSGSWENAFKGYNQIVRRSGVPLIRSRAFLGEVQMCINLGRLSQAQNILDNSQDFLQELPGGKKEKFETEVYIKRTWILEKRGNFKEALKFLDKIDEKIEDEDSDLYRHILHFTGRSLVSLGVLEHDKKKVEHADKIFSRELDYYSNQRAIGNTNPESEGFSFLWLAKANYALGDRTLFYLNLEDAEKCFNEFIMDNILKNARESGIMANIHLLHGQQLMLEGGNLSNTFETFAEAYRLTTLVEPRPLAAAEAGFALARLYAATGNREYASRWANYALTVYPEQLNRPFAG